MENLAMMFYFYDSGYLYFLVGPNTYRTYPLLRVYPIN